MANPITIVNVSQTQAPAPSRLQQAGAIISQGGTTGAAGTLTRLAQSSDLDSILVAPAAVTGIVQAGGVATATTTAPHGLPVGEPVEAFLAGAVQADYNGQKTVTATTTTAFTFTVPGGAVTPATGTITWKPYAAVELPAQVATFFAQPIRKSVYVLELGKDGVDAGVADLLEWIEDNQNRIYSYLVPSAWDANADFLTAAGLFTAPDKRTYFFVTTTEANEAFYEGVKSIIAGVPSPDQAAGTFFMAGPFSSTLGWKPSSTQQVPPLEYAFLYGVAAWDPYGNQGSFDDFAENNINYPGTGAEGGLSNVVLFGGNLQDGNPFNYWYAIDWAAIELQLAITNLVMNGSNSQPYLYYNQQGINRLQAKGIQVLGRAISYGLANGRLVSTQLPYLEFAEKVANGDYAGQVVFNAEPFSVYTEANPNDYSIGKYGGLAASFAPLRGFDQIIVNLNATSFVS